jgi:hypothetical protein
MRTLPRLLLIMFVALSAIPLSGQDRPSVAERNAPLPGPLPLFPADNWWNLDISQAPVAAESAQFVNFIGATKGIHPDFGGLESAGSQNIYGMPYVVVDQNQPKRAVFFDYDDESDGHGVPFYPIPDEAITQPYWIEGGPPGNSGAGGDRHMLIVDKDNKFLYELFALRWTGGRWEAGSGAFFDMKTNNRRPEGWTSADAAGLAILPGLIRYDEAFGSEPIRHAFRVTVRGVNGYVYPASHRASTNAAGPPLGARMRLKADKTYAGGPEIQRIVQALKTYGLIVADTGSDMYVQGTHDTRWNNGVLNPRLGAIKAGDFEFVQLGWRGGCPAGSAPPDAPGNFTASVNGLQATFAWSLSGGTAASLSLEVGSGPGQSNLAALTLPGSATSYTASGTAGTYYARVRASNACGSAASNEVVFSLSSACTPPGVPGAPVATVAGSQVTLTWAAGAGATSHVFEAGNVPGLANLLSTPVSATSLSASAPPGTYYVRARGRNGCGTSAPSADTTVVVGGCGAPGSASPLAYTVSGRTVTLSWSGAPGATEYVLEAGSVAGASNLLVMPLGANTSFTATAPPGTYYVRVRPRNPCGSGSATNELAVVVA